MISVAFPRVLGDNEYQARHGNYLRDEQLRSASIISAWCNDKGYVSFASKILTL